MAALVDDNKAVYARFANRVEDCVQAVTQRASINAGEVLRYKCQLKRARERSWVRRERIHTSDLFSSALPTES
jgi:hypothetical protein